MQLNGGAAAEWSVEQVFVGERLYCGVTVAAANAVVRAVREAEVFGHLPLNEVTGVVVHALMETAMRQIMVSKTPVSLAQFEEAARLVYVACHQHEKSAQ